MSSPQTISQLIETTDAAKALITRYPQKAIELLETPETIKEFIKCCSRDNVDHYQVIAEMKRLEERELNKEIHHCQRRRSTDESVESRLSRQQKSRPLSSDITPAPSAQDGFGSSSSLGGSTQRVKVRVTQEKKDEILRGHCDPSPESCFLIKSEIAHERLDDEPKRQLLRPIPIIYREKHLRCEQVVRLTWSFVDDEGSHRNWFLLIDGADINTDIVIGGRDPPDHQLQSSDVTHGHANKLYSGSQYKAPSSEVTNFEPPPIPNTMRTPQRPSSPHNVDFDPKYSPSTEPFYVILVCENSNAVVELDLEATGEAFFESLQGHVREVRKCPDLVLNRKQDLVIFATAPEYKNGLNLRVKLQEPRMAGAWMIASKWIKSTQKNLAPEDMFYAILQEAHS